MKLYTVILVWSENKNDGPFPAICYNSKTPILTEYKHIAEFERDRLKSWCPQAEFKVGEINVG